MDFAECSVTMRRLITQAEQCERDKLYRAAVVELEEIISLARRAMECCYAKDEIGG